MTDEQREKAHFVKKLQLFYKRDCENPEGIKRLDYVYSDEAGTEFIYVTYKSESQKRIFVGCDSKQQMLMDFCHFLDNADHYFWLLPGEAAFREEFLEDE